MPKTLCNLKYHLKRSSLFALSTYFKYSNIHKPRRFLKIYLKYIHLHRRGLFEGNSSKNFSQKIKWNTNYNENVILGRLKAFQILSVGIENVTCDPLKLKELLLVDLRIYFCVQCRSSGWLWKGMSNRVRWFGAQSTTLKWFACTLVAVAAAWLLLAACLWVSTDRSLSLFSSISRSLCLWM